jgi:hypothetical protein
LLVLDDDDGVELAADVEDDDPLLPHAARTVVPAKAAITAVHLVVNRRWEEIRTLLLLRGRGKHADGALTEALPMTSREL